MKTGGGTQTTTADMPSDWRQQMDDELREAYNEVDVTSDEFTIADAMDDWAISYGRAARKLAGMVEAGVLATRKAYDPRVQKQVNAYKRVINAGDSSIKSGDSE